MYEYRWTYLISAWLRVCIYVSVRINDILNVDACMCVSGVLNK